MKNYGFIREEPKKEDYILGGQSKSPHIELARNGQWTDYLPSKERQLRNIETSSCVSFTVLNAIEVLNKRKFNLDVNYSDRYLAAASLTNQVGNTPNKVCETLRKFAGCIPEENHPFTDEIMTFEEYIKEPGRRHFAEGRRWLNKYEFTHEWVPANEFKLMQGLRYSPIGISVYGWLKNDDYYFKPQGEDDNHFTLLIGYEYKKYWLVFDSYSEIEDDVYFKKLKWDYFDDNTIAKSFGVEYNKDNCRIKNLFV